MTNSNHTDTSRRDDLVDLIEAARNHKMTAAEKFEQRVSFVYGQQDFDKPGRSKDEIRRSVADAVGYPLDELAAKDQRIEALEAENERLRVALELIRDPNNVYYAGEMRAFARAALGEKK